MDDGDYEPSCKRKKTECGSSKPIDDIFYNFLKDDEAIRKLKGSCSAVEQGSFGCSLAFYELISANARSSRSFSKADADFKTYSNIFPIGDIFVGGIDVLKKYLNKQLPKDERMLKALSKLLQFFFSYKDHQILMDERKTDTEGHWSIAVAQHLLVKLAVHNTYTVDSCRGVTSKTNLCPCKELDVMVGNVGDTSYGCVEGWHGSADILLEEELPVNFVKGEQAETEDDDRSVSSVEIKLKKKINEYEKSQVIAETIVFSFLQKNKGNLKQSLVPGIAITSEVLSVYFYDSENDLLMGSLPVDIFSDEEIRPQAILILWLTLNYKMFCSGSTQAMKSYKAAFFDLVGDCISMYRDKKKLTRPCIVSNQTRSNKQPTVFDFPRPFKDIGKPEIDYFELPEKE